MQRRQILPASLAIAALTLLPVLGGGGAAEAANPCKKNCKPVYTACKDSTKAAFEEAKAEYKATKDTICDALSGDARKACVLAAKELYKLAKDHKKLGLKDCKARYKEVQLPMCTAMGLMEVCSPDGGFVDSVESSLF